VNAQGEDVVAGIRNTEPLSALGSRFPSIYAELMEIFSQARSSLPGHVRHRVHDRARQALDAADPGRQGTGRAALRMVVDMVDDPAIRLTHAEALQRTTAEHIEAVLHPQFADNSSPVLAKASLLRLAPRSAPCGFTADDAAAAAANGEHVILVRNETSPEDVHGMLAAEGILTARGGLVSHAAVVARGWASRRSSAPKRYASTHPTSSSGSATPVVREGEVISIDGSEGTVVIGAVPLIAAEAPPELTKLLDWADEIRSGRLGVRANADTGDDAANARKLGAEGSACAGPSTCSSETTACRS